MKVVFIKCLLIVLQAELPGRANPTELKAIFEKVGILPTDFFFCSSPLCLPLIEEAFHLTFDLRPFLFDQILKLSMRPSVFVSGFLFTVCQRREV